MPHPFLEDCPRLDIIELHREFKKHRKWGLGEVAFGSFTWVTKGISVNLNIVYCRATNRGHCTIAYEYPGRPGDPPEPVRIVADLYRPFTTYSKKHYWQFICPLIVNGRPCGRPVDILYIARSKYFGCKYCQRVRDWEFSQQYMVKKGGMMKRLNKIMASPAKFVNALKRAKTIRDKKELLEAYRRIVGKVRDARAGIPARIKRKYNKKPKLPSNISPI